MAAAIIPDSPAIAFRLWLSTQHPSPLLSKVISFPDVRARSLVVRCSTQPQPELPEEKIYDPGRKQFISKEELGSSFKGINQILLLGQGAQVHARAMNLADSLSGSGIRVNSVSHPILNRRSIFTIRDLKETISGSDLIMLFTEDANQAADYEEIFSHMKPGSIIGLSNGNLVSHLRSQGVSLRKDISSVFKSETNLLKRQGDFNDANATTDFVAYQDLDGRAKNVFALAWALSVGSLISACTQEQKYGESGTSLSDLKRLGQGYAEQIKETLCMDKLRNGHDSSACRRSTTSTTKVEGTRAGDSNLLKEVSQAWIWDPFQAVTRNPWLSMLIITPGVYLVAYALSRFSPSPDISSTRTSLSAGLSREGATLVAARTATSISLTKNLLKAVNRIVPVLGLALYIIYR